MTRRDKFSVLGDIERNGVVPVFHHSDLEVVKGIAASLVAGGIPILEFTNRGEGAVDVFADLARWVRSELPDITLGVGSVVDPSTASYLIDSGASFVVAPALSREVAETCHARNIPYVPGCGTLTEILSAYRMGVDIVKLFPANQIGGPSFLKAVKAPCPWVKAMPTGGVEPTVESLSSWYQAGAPAVGMGSRLITKELVEARDWDGLQAQIAECVATVTTARKET